jgi:hypothetical protein
LSRPFNRVEGPDAAVAGSDREATLPLVRVLYANKLLEIAVSDDARIAWIRRNNTSSRDGTAKEVEEFFVALARLPSASMAVVIDVREAQGRNDDEFERRIMPQFNDALSRFAYQAMVVKTEVGRIQAKRLAKERGAEVDVFADPEDARRAALAKLG